MPARGSASGGTPRADVVYCFLHKDIRASGPCSTCGRPYCPACLNTAGFCGLCAQHNDEARRRAFSAPGEAEANAAGARRRGRAWLVQGLVAVVMLGGAGWGYHRIKHRAPEPSKPDLATQLKASELTPQERAFLASLKRERRVAMPDAPQPAAQRQRARELEPVYAQAEARRETLGHAPPAQAAAPVEAVTIQGLTPVDGSIVGGRAPIRVWTTGSPSKVVCEVDGGVIGVQAGPRPVFLWNTRAAGNGPHQVTITASGRGGTSSASLTLNVMNR